MKILIDLDEGFIARIERERQVAQNATATETFAGKRPARTAMIRTLLVESLDRRCVERGEEIPVVTTESLPVEPIDA